MKRTSLRKAGAVALSTAVLLGGALLIAQSSSAAPAGTLTFEPKSGFNTSSITVTTSGPCTDPNATNLEVTFVGSGFPDHTHIVGNTAISAFTDRDPATGGYKVPFQESLQDKANEQTPQATLSGRYDFTLTCRTKTGLGSLGDFVGSITFTSSTTYTDGSSPSPSASPTASPSPTPSSTPPPSPTLALTVATNTHTTGNHGKVILKATVSPKQAGHDVTFYRRSGLTGKVVPAGNAAVDSSGVATREINGNTGAIQLIYSILRPNTGFPVVRSNDVSYKFK